jgi:hypothetical protein
MGRHELQIVLVSTDGQVRRPLERRGLGAAVGNEDVGERVTE